MNIFILYHNNKNSPTVNSRTKKAKCDVFKRVIKELKKV